MYFIYVERPLLQAAGSHASTKPSRTIGLAQSFVSSVKYPHSCGSFGFHSLPPFPRPYTTTYPLYRVTYLVGLAGFGNYLVAFGCTYGLNTVHFHSIGLSVSFAAVSIRYTYRLAPWLLYLLSDLNKCFCLLTGIISIRPSAFVERWRSRTACSSKLFGESSPLWSDAVALVSAMSQAFPYSNICLFAPTIQAFTFQICLS